MLGHCLAGRKEKEKQAFCVSLPRGPRTGANNEPPIGMMSMLARKGKVGPLEKSREERTWGAYVERGTGQRPAGRERGNQAWNSWPMRKKKGNQPGRKTGHAGKEKGQQANMAAAWASVLRPGLPLGLKKNIDKIITIIIIIII